MDDFLLDDPNDERELGVIRSQLPQEARDRFASDDLLRWMLYSIAEYYFDQGIFDSDDDEVEIDMEAVAHHICRRAREERNTELDWQDVFFVVQADLDYQESDLD